MEGGTRLPTQEDIERTYLKKYDSAYGPTYTVLDLLQKLFYTNNGAREAFVELCASKYVQQVTFDSYLYKKVQGNNPIDDIKLLGETVACLIKGYAKKFNKLLGETVACLIKGYAGAKPDAKFEN